jgi:cobalamin biosynthesis protein CobD/CbiB
MANDDARRGSEVSIDPRAREVLKQMSKHMSTISPDARRQMAEQASSAARITNLTGLPKQLAELEATKTALNRQLSDSRLAADATARAYARAITGTPPKLPELRIPRAASGQDIVRLEGATRHSLDELTRATLQVVEAIEENAVRDQRQAQWLVWLTVALVVLTVAILGLTAVMVNGG